MNRKERLELAHWAIAAAKNSGVNEAAVNINNSRDIEVEFRDSKLDRLKESTQNSLSLSIYADNRYSSHSTNDIRKSSLEKFIKKTVAMTKYLNEDPYRTLPDSKYYKGQKDIELNHFDPAYDNVTSEQRVEIAKEIEGVAMAQSDKIISCTSGYSDSFYESVKVHSNGFEGERRATAFSAGASVTVDDEKTGGRPRDWEWVTVRHYKDLLSPDKLGKTAVTRALSKIGQKKMESGRYDMVIENRSAGRILSYLRSPLLGRSLQQKRSCLEDKLGEKIGSEKFTVIDDPFIVGGLGSRLYDGEGLATKRRVIFDKGVLKTFFIDWYYGQKLGMEPTGGSTTNIVFDYGKKSLDELIRQMKKGILVTSFIGGNSNSATGDFSVGIVGQYVENGKIVKPINEMNISGNIMEFWKQLIDVGNDPRIYSSWRLPSLYFKDIQFSGI
jgi:PmbA protein